MVLLSASALYLSKESRWPKARINPEGVLMAVITDTRPDAGRVDTALWTSRAMTVDEFYQSTDTRPDGEKWELIEGEPVLNASPTPLHQWIIGNVLFALVVQEREIGAQWAASLPLGVRISEIDRPEPDVLAIRAGGFQL
jgi:hypothetical protein